MTIVNKIVQPKNMGIMKRTTSNKSFIMALAIMLVGMFSGVPVKTSAQSLDSDTASVTVTPDADLPFAGIDTAMVATPDTGTVETPAVPDEDEGSKEPVVVDDATLRAMMAEFIGEGIYHDDFNAIDSAFQVRLEILNIKTTIEDVHSVLKEEFKKINSADDIPEIDYFVKKIMNSNKYQGGSGLVGIEEVEVDEEKGDGAIYDLSGIRLPAPPEHGIYIKNGKKYLAK